VCINESLDSGTTNAFVQNAYENNMSVIILNPNEREDPNTEKDIPEFSNMTKHCVWTWENIIKKFSPAKEYYIVAHSMGGYCTVDILIQFPDEVNKIKKIAFTDSVHGSRFTKLNIEAYKGLAEKSINFVTSDKEAGTFLKSFEESRE
jgi:hypothetical protein